MKIFLIGFMGCGKSTFGKRLARKMGYVYLDTDEAIENDYGQSIGEIFKQYGEPVFRKEENKALRKLMTFDDLVIATGGGLPCHYENMDLMNTNGITVYLQLPPKALFKRLKNSKGMRPLLVGMNDSEILSFIESELEKREKYYLQAKISVNAMRISPIELCRTINHIEVTENDDNE